MPDPIGSADFTSQPPAVGPVRRPWGVPADQSAGAGDFKGALLESLEEVNRLQQEAAEGVERLATGESHNVAEVLSAVNKADIAFSMMMEMRNKLIDAYRELQQMRV